MRFLVLGGSGQLGTQLQAIALPHGVALIAPTRAAVDVSNLASIRQIVAAEAWSAVIYAAGYTDVDRAESEEELAFAINAEAATCLAAETANRGIPLIYTSTDYVFDGRKGAPYVENDLTAPLNAYGRSKLSGEQGVAAANHRHVILRTAWLYSPHGANFVRSILRLARERERLFVVTDQIGSPTSARDLAQACVDIAIHLSREPERTDHGLYHFAGAGAANRYEFATAIIEQAAGRLGRVPHVEPISTAQCPRPANRPADSRLDCRAIQSAFGLTPRPWRGALAEAVDDLLSSHGVT